MIAKLSSFASAISAARAAAARSGIPERREEIED